MWLQHTTLNERRALLAGYLGYGLDGFDFMVYTLFIPTLMMQWNMGKDQAGYIASAALVTSAIGGWAAGVLADRFGRARVLQITVVWFAVFTFLSGFTQNFAQLLITRSLQGFGFGGEWAVGSVLVAEVIDARHRGKAAGLVQSSWSVGWAAAAVAFWAASKWIAPQFAWRVVMWAGLLPVLVTIYIRRYVREPEVYLAQRASPAAHTHFLAIFKPPLLYTTLMTTVLSTGMLAGYYSITTWLPAYLATERHLSLGNTTGYLLTVIFGSLVGYLTAAWLADLIGRRRCFVIFALGASLFIVLYTRGPLAGGMLLVGFALGFFILGVFSGMGAYLAELFPGELRGSGQGFSYSMGRGIGGFCPALVGVLALRMPLGEAIWSVTVASYSLVVIATWLLPETKGKSLASTKSAAAA